MEWNHEDDIDSHTLKFVQRLYELQTIIFNLEIYFEYELRITNITYKISLNCKSRFM